MKKIISILLLSGLLLTCFSGCGLIDRLTGGSQTENPTKEPIVLPKPQADENDLIANLVEYLDWLDADWDQLPTSVAIKINQIRREDSVFKRQPVHVEIDPSSYYFMCGYYNPSHENASRDEYESEDYCCVTEYTWVKFNSEKEIREYHNGEKMIVAFQINESSFVKDVLTGDVNVLGYTHYQLYETQFVDGININAPDNLDKTFIFLFNEMFTHGQVDRKYIYNSTEQRAIDWVTFPCTKRDGQYYILVKLYVVNSNEERSDVNLTRELGEYYNTLIEMIQTDKEYSIADERGSMHFYGLIPMYDFVNAVLK